MTVNLSPRALAEYLSHTWTDQGVVCFCRTCGYQNDKPKEREEVWEEHARHHLAEARIRGGG